MVRPEEGVTERQDRNLPRSAPESAGSTSAISIRGVSKTFRSRGAAVQALADLSLEVESGEIMVLLGPSGCGKTTLLRSVAGLERPDRGSISIDGRTVYSSADSRSLPPEARELGMVFQSYALWPHMTVFDNVAYPLQSRRQPRGDVAARVHDVLQIVGCAGLESRYPSQLSGGQQQRVALARAVVASQKVVLFDEPLSNVDAKVREQLRIELMTMQRRLGFAAIYVTHDQVEAMVIGTRIAVMRHGRIVQVGTPAQIYDHPASRYVAEFVGSANFVSGVVDSIIDGAVRVRTSLGPVQADLHSSQLRVADQVTLFFRPEHCLLRSEAAGGNSWPCMVERTLFLGPHEEHIVQAGQEQLLVWKTGRLPLVFDGLWLSIEPSLIQVLDPGSR